MNVTTGLQPTPQRTLLYGVAGIGKTTCAAQFPAPVFIPTEDGCGHVPVARFPICKTLANAMDAIGELFTEDHEFKTVVVDSADWLEQLIFAEVCREFRVQTVGDIDYGKGYLRALSHWRTITAGLDALRTRKRMSTVLLAHETFDRFEDPERSGYDRYAPALQRLAREYVCGWCDNVLFANYEVLTRETAGKFKKQVTKAVGEGRRILRCQQRPAAVAKNRLGMPAEIDFSWDAIAPFFSPVEKQ